MAISNTVIQIKKSGVTGNVPSSLGSGELALNYVDNKLFYKNSTGGTSWFYGANNGPSFATFSNGVSLITATAPNDTLTYSGANGITIVSNTTTKTITFGVNLANTYSTINVTGGIASTNVNTGSLLVTGGMGVTGNIYANAIYAVSAIYANGVSVSGGGGTSNFPTLNVTGGIASTSNITGSLLVTGGIGVTGNVFSSNTVTGAILVANNGILLNSNTIYNSITIGSNQNGLSVGPISYYNGSTVTVPTGSRWVIL